jgi:hypothetical protein
MELVEALHREDIEQAKRMTLAQKFYAGAELFDDACRVTSSGIRFENPSFTPGQVLAELRRRIALGDRLSEMLAEGW